MTDTSERVRVVIADDYDDLRFLARAVLETDSRFEVVAEAANGREAVEQAARHHPSLLLLDIAMPEIDGLEAIPLVAAASPETTIVMYSGFAEGRMASAALELGASGYIEKGVHPSTFIARLLAAVSVN